MTSSRRDGAISRRWVLHLALIAGFVATFVTAIFLSKRYLGLSGVADHAVVSLLVFAFVLVHLFQRRRTIRSLFARRAVVAAPRARLARSDLVLWLLTLNAMISGAADFLNGTTIYLPIPGPIIFQKWHALSVLILLAYVTTHVTRRRRRLRTSHVR